MKNTFVIFKKEAGSYFNSAVAYFNIIAYLAVSAWLFFWLGFFFERKQTEMTYFFSLMPWLFLFFIPAMTMRLWAEEKKMGTVEWRKQNRLPNLKLLMGRFSRQDVRVLVVVDTPHTMVSAPCHPHHYTVRS